MKTKQEIFLIYYSYNLRFLQGEFEALCVSHLMWAYAANNCTHLSACPTCELVYAFCASGGGMNVLICMMCIVNTFQLLYVVVSFSLPLAPPFATLSLCACERVFVYFSCAYSSLSLFHCEFNIACRLHWCDMLSLRIFLMNISRFIPYLKFQNQTKLFQNKRDKHINFEKQRTLENAIFVVFMFLLFLFMCNIRLLYLLSNSFAFSGCSARLLQFVECIEFAKRNNAATVCICHDIHSWACKIVLECASFTFINAIAHVYYMETFDPTLIKIKRQRRKSHVHVLLSYMMSGSLYSMLVNSSAFRCSLFLLQYIHTLCSCI